MSATLTWYNSGLGTKTGTAIGNYFTDFKTLIDSKAADSNFTWEVCASSLVGTPYYLFLRRKDLSAGRLLLISWSSAPAGNNAAILDTAPTTSTVYIAWFPAGTANTPSNLTASSGTIAGDDTGCTRCASAGAISTIYTTSFQPYYFDCVDGVAFCTGHTGNTNAYWVMAGNLVVDASDVAYGISYGPHSIAMPQFGANSSTPLLYSSAGALAGAASTYAKSNYASQSLGTNTSAWYHAWICPSWAATAIGSTDILSDTSTTDVWFVPVQLVNSYAKGGGFPLKLRQVAIGPQSLGTFSIYNTTGPVVQARCGTPAAASSTGCPWFVNFKI